MDAANESDLLNYFWQENLTSYLEEPSDALKTLWENGKWEIPLYSIIFLLSVVGNILVILTLMKNIRMRTNTNVFLLNLAMSDLVLAVLCMPFTLIGTLLRNFVFGEAMCRLVPFLQATSVAASVWTLVALSVERYYAICHPLRSRGRQSLSHAYHLIGYIWAGGAATMLPIGILSELQPTNKGHHKCRESWPNGEYERAYNLFLDILLLVIPLLVLAVTYYLIAKTLWRDFSKIPDRGSGKKPSLKTLGSIDCCHGKPRYSDHGVELVFVSDACDEGSMVEPTDLTLNTRTSVRFSTFADKTEKKVFGRLKFSKMEKCSKESIVQTELSYPKHLENFNGFSDSPSRINSFKSSTRIGLRHTNYERSLRKKQRVIKMLFVVVLEFFVCWTPLYVINTVALFWPHLVYGGMGYKMISFCQLLAYTSGCCNPITYCFMNKGFRHSFISLFGFCKRK